MMHVCMYLKHPRLLIPSSNAGLPLSTCTADQDQTATDVQIRTRLRLSVSETSPTPFAHSTNFPLTEAFGWNFKVELVETETHRFTTPKQNSGLMDSLFSLLQAKRKIT